MSLTPHEKRLLRVSKSSIGLLRDFREGVSIEADFSRPISDLMHQVVADRIRLAERFLDMAQRLHRSRSDLSRSSISRYYYAMYHAMRAAAYQHHAGDDHEQHSELSAKGVPRDFPNRGTAQNDLKNARLWRNEADYDPYPVSATYFVGVEKGLKPIATSFVASATAYVRSKGNSYV